MKALIVEDEAPARARLKRLLADEPTIQLIGEATNLDEARTLIEVTKPEVLFLDIQLWGKNAFSLLSEWSQEKELPLIIFTTAYSEFAVAAFEQNAVDYLLKPIEKARLKQAIFKLASRQPVEALNAKLLASLLAQLNRPNEMTSLSVKTGDRYIFVRFSEITHFEAKDKYVMAFTDSGKSHLLEQSLKMLLEKLPPNFVQVHRSIVINRDTVSEIQRYFGKRYLLLLGNAHNRTQITSGAHFADAVKVML